MKHWIEGALAAQGITVSAGRAERLARAQQALLDAGAADRLREALDFDADVPAFLLAIEKCK